MNTSNARVWLSIGLAMLVLTNSGCGGSGDRQEKYLKRGQEHYAAGNVDKARIEIKNVLQINPKNAEARLLMAKISRDQGEYRQAFGLYNAIIEDEPNNIEARLELAKIYFAGEQSDQALEHVDVILAAIPDHKDAQLLVAAVESRRGNSAQAIQIAESLLEKHPNDPGAVAIIASSLVTDEPEKALERVEAALVAHPDDVMLKRIKLQILGSLQRDGDIEAHLRELVKDHPEIMEFHFQLARGLIVQERRDEAEAVLRNAVDKNPETMKAKLALIEFVSRDQGVEKAEALLAEMVNKSPESFELKKLLAQFYADNKKLPEAKEVFTSFLKKNNTGADALSARYHLAQIHLSEGDRATAERLLNEIFTQEPSNTSALILRAKLHLSDNRNKDAIADLRAALKNDNTSVEALKLLAMAQEREREHQLALDSYYRILDMNPLDTGALLGAANINLNMNENSRAQQLLENLTKVDKYNPTAVAMLMRLYGNQELWAKAHGVVEPLLERPNTRVAGLILRGDLERGQKEWDKARQSYMEALKSQPGALEAVAGYTDTFLIEKDFAGAKAFLTEHLKQNPKLDYAREMLAKVHLLAGEKDAAVNIYRNLITQAPERISPVQRLAGIYISDKNPKAAEEVLRNGIVAHPNVIDLQLMLASLYDMQARHKEAADLYEAILTKDADNLLARNNLAVLLVNHFANEKNLARAMELIAPLADSREAAFLNTVGWVHYKNGNYPQAVSYLQAAVKQQPKSGEFRYHLGMALYKSGDLSGAKSELNLAVGEDRDYVGREEAKQTLASISQGV